MPPLHDASVMNQLSTAFQYIVPEVTLLASACLLLVAALFKVGKSTSLGISLLSVAGAGICALFYPEPDLAHAFRALAPFDPNGAAQYCRWFALGLAVCFCLLAHADSRDDFAAEFQACTLVAVAGLSLTSRANDLISLFLSLELISIPTYLMLYLPDRSQRAQEATLKYFMLSVLSSAFLLLGFSYLFGLSGSTNLIAVVDAVTDGNLYGAVSPLSLVAIILVIAGLGFRITSVPFHFYAPDVYEGGPVSVVAQLAIIPKIAGFIVLARLLGFLYPPLDEIPFTTGKTLIPLLLWAMALVTICFGNILALLQDNLRRMLAYSGIAHSGYMFIGLLVASSLPDTATPKFSGIDAILIYLVVYAIMTIALFASLIALRSEERPMESIDDLAGVAQSNPYVALFIMLTMFSMIGLPLTGGFIGKFFLFYEALQAPTNSSMQNFYQIIVVVAVVNAALAALYYLRLISVMYFRTALKPVRSRRWTPAFCVAFGCTILTIVIGIFPQQLINQARKAAPAARQISPDDPNIEILK